MKNLSSLHVQKSVIVPADFAGYRLDQALAILVPDYSRSRLQQWIKTGAVKVDGQSWRAKDKLIGGETIVIDAQLETETGWSAQQANIKIVFEDDEILVVNKSADMVVHPGAGSTGVTLANALLDYLPQLADIPRAGIVHRLDKNTSGLLVVAKTLASQHALVAAIQNREVHREYLAIVNGVCISGGTIDAPMGRDAKNRQKMAIITSGKPAVTHYRIIERFRAHTLLKVILETGRTHQIRVHLSHRGFSILGDKVYGARPIVPKQASPELLDAIRGYSHQALHAKKLCFKHPKTNELLTFEVEAPDKMLRLIELLRRNVND